MAGVGAAPVALVVLGDGDLAAARRVRSALPGALIHGLAGRVSGADIVFTESGAAIRQLFVDGVPIVAFCAAGSVIRALSPLLAVNRAEPPVLAVAEDGSAVVPLLGGSRADDLARTVAEALGAVPAITTTGQVPGVTPRHGHGHLAVVGLGPGGDSWMTPEARRALTAAEDIVGYTAYLRMAAPFGDDQRIHASDNGAEMDRARHALALAARGRKVAVVSSGDPGVFAMASAVMEALEQSNDAAWHDIELAIVPGISAMQAAAARAGAPLGHDFCVLSLSDNLKPWAVIERRLASAAAADLVLALYNPVSRARPWQLDRAAEIVRRYRTAATPVVLGRDLGRPGERMRIVSLAELSAEDADMRTVVIIGSSTTRAFRRADGGMWVYTPRRYEEPMPINDPAPGAPSRSPR